MEGVRLTFSNVDSGGQTVILTPTSSVPPPPGGFEFQGSVYDISTTANITGAVEVCLPYSSSSDPATLYLKHFESGDWKDVTTVRDPSNSVICGVVTSLSPFALARASSTPSPPVLALPSNAVAEASDASGAIVAYTATATDAGGAALPVTCAPASGSLFPIGGTPVTCTATDATGSSVKGTFIATVTDSTPPVVETPDPIVVSATSAAGTTVTYAASAADVVDGTVALGCSREADSIFEPGTTTVSCSSIDAAGNVGAGSFTVRVLFSWSDVLPPLNADGSSIVQLGRTIPVKFQLTGASAGIADLVAKLYVAKVTDQIVGTELEAPATVAADVGNTFRYDPADRSYVFNLSTKGLSRGTWQLRIDLRDGAPHTVLISLK
jgi:hypothetical protein